MILANEGSIVSDGENGARVAADMQPLCLGRTVRVWLQTCIVLCLDGENGVSVTADMQRFSMDGRFLRSMFQFQELRTAPNSNILNHYFNGCIFITLIYLSNVTEY